MPGRFLRFAIPTHFSSLLLGLCLATIGAAQPKANFNPITGQAAAPLRMAISDQVVYGVTLADARAAMAVWSGELLRDVDLKLAPEQDWVKSSDQLLAAIRGGTVDMFCLTVKEYRQVTQYVDTSRIITDDHGGEELLLVVREGSGIVNLAGLRGRSMIMQSSPNTSVAEAWLAVSLWRAGLESPNQFLGRITKQTKLSQAILPVFFGQADACVVTRRGLNTMSELNPQLTRTLRVLLSSPRMVSAFFAWRRNYPAELKNPIFDRLLKLKSSRTAAQVLTLFQSPGYTSRDASCLSPADSVLEAYERRLELLADRKR